MTVNATSSTTAAAQASAPASAAAQAPSTEDRFLKMLVAQLQNQDPLNPMDNAQVTSQMAQLSTVNGIDKLNSSISSVLTAISALQPIQAAGMVGKNVAVEGNAIQLTKGAATGGFSVDQAVDAMTVTVKNAAGTVVRTIDLGARPASISTFTWDGKNDAGLAQADGNYTFSIAASAAGKAVTPRTLAVATVQGVVPASDGFALNLGALGVVPFANVAQIL